MLLLYTSIFKLKHYNRSCKTPSALNAIDFRGGYFTRPLRDYLVTQRTVPVMLATFKSNTYKHKVKFVPTTVTKKYCLLLKCSSPFCTYFTKMVKKMQKT